MFLSFYFMYKSKCIIVELKILYAKLKLKYKKPLFINVHEM